jgi:Proteasome subunit
MTSIVGVLCEDGVVIGTDSSATFGTRTYRTIEQPFEKIDIIGGHIIVAGTGQIGLGQRFCEVVNKSWDEKKFQLSSIEVGKHLSKSAIQDFGETRAEKGQYGALVGFPIGHTPHLCEFAVDDFQPELKTERLWYCSMGSAQSITDPFLAFIRDAFWSNGRPNLYDGIFATVWALAHAIQVNPGGVNGPIRIGILERTHKGQFEARLLAEEELGEHYQNIDEVKSSLQDFQKQHQAPESDEIPDIPKP